MKMRPLGSSGIETSVVGLGTWAIGGWMWGGSNENESIATIHAALDAGVNLIDTAPVYGLGRSEIVVGKALKGRRDRVVLATKCGLVCNPNVGIPFFRSDSLGASGNGHVPIHKYLGADSIRTEVEASLSRLQTDYIDLYQTHWQDPTTTIEETMTALMKLKREGKIRAIGVSNATAAQMETYRQTGPLDADQERFSMIDRKIEADQMPYCKEHNIALLGYSPLALGLLTGKIGPDRAFEAGDQRLHDKRFSVEHRQLIRTMLDAFLPIAETHRCTIAQLVVAWSVTTRNVTHALCGARHPQQAQENAHAGSIELTAMDLKAINKAIQEYQALKKVIIGA